jgi:uncharacterized RDD family membrane protein YckC
MAEDTPSFERASLLRRLLALYLDALPFGFVCGLAAAFLAPPKSSLLGLAAFAVFCFWQAQCLSTRGSTPARRWLGLEVRAKEGGGPPSFLAALGRGAAYPLSALGGLGFAWALFQPEGRAWHDLLAGTVVVEAEESPVVSRVAGAALGAMLLAAGAAAWLWVHLAAGPYTDMERVIAARKSLLALESMQRSHRSLRGRYTSDLAALAGMSDDWKAFLANLDQTVEVRELRMRAHAQGYHIEARARDSRRTLLSLSGPRRRRAGASP